MQQPSIKRKTTGKIIIAPSMLAADFARLGQEIEAVDQAGADWIHIDVMDGHFVPNMTIGPDMVQALRKYTNKPFDVHLMMEPVEPWIQRFAAAGADYITVHPEATRHLDRCLDMIHLAGKKAGVALNPATHPQCLQFILDKIDLVLIMSVNPGFGGQKFLSGQLKKIRLVQTMLEDQNILLAVDGGIDIHQAPLVKEAGANVLIAGSAVFGQKDDKEAIHALRLGSRGDGKPD